MDFTDFHLLSSFSSKIPQYSQPCSGFFFDLVESCVQSTLRKYLSQSAIHPNVFFSLPFTICVSIETNDLVVASGFSLPLRYSFVPSLMFNMHHFVKSGPFGFLSLISIPHI